MHIQNLLIKCKKSEISVYATNKNFYERVLQAAIRNQVYLMLCIGIIKRI